MKKLAVLALGMFGLLLTACSGVPTQQQQVRNANEVAPFPDAEPGFVRSVIFLPELKDENSSKVELIIGKEMVIDCNIHRLAGTVKQQDLKGWGYQYYVVNTAAGGISTMMACPTDFEYRKEFVTMNHDLGLLRYNSRLPIVVYAPEGAQVKYRVWSASSSDPQPASVQ